MLKWPTIARISHSSSVTLTILQASLQQYMNFQMFKLVLEKACLPVQQKLKSEEMHLTHNRKQ